MLLKLIKLVIKDKFLYYINYKFNTSLIMIKNFKTLIKLNSSLNQLNLVILQHPLENCYENKYLFKTTMLNIFNTFIYICYINYLYNILDTK
jgi:hypothetical protein